MAGLIVVAVNEDGLQVLGPVFDPTSPLPKPIITISLIFSSRRSMQTDVCEVGGYIHSGE
jgi:hypothetical protein